jgi:hypothetical protein
MASDGVQRSRDSLLRDSETLLEDASRRQATDKPSIAAMNGNDGVAAFVLK